MKNRFLFAVLFISLKLAAQTPEQNLERLKIQLPKAGNPIASYVNAVRSGNLVFLAGKGPQKENGVYIRGKLGDSITVQEGYEAARLTAINQLSVLKELLGDLGKVKRIVKVNGFVNSTSNFYDQSKVVRAMLSFGS